MDVVHIPGEEFANKSEQDAFDALVTLLRNTPGNFKFYLFTNLLSSARDDKRPDEIDLVVIGPRGIQVVEIKHWDRGFLKSNPDLLNQAASAIELKARRIKGRLKQRQRDLGFVPAKLLLTKEQKSLCSPAYPAVLGVPLHALCDLRDLLELDGRTALPEGETARLASALERPGMRPVIGDLRRIGHCEDLKRLSAKEERFHRIYSGRNSSSQDRLIIHLYDLSAAEGTSARQRAEREFKAIQRFQKSPWLPSLMDSWQPVPGYAGELYYFSLAESGAPSLLQKARDAAWLMHARVAFAAQALKALAELHAPSDDNADPALVHRGLTPETIRVRSDGTPLFTDLAWARLADAQTVSGSGEPDATTPFVAPEVVRGGLGAADMRSDVFSLCAVLATLFVGDAPEAVNARDALEHGTANTPEDRASLEDIAGLLLPTAADPKAVIDPVNVAPPASVWDEKTRIELSGKMYQVLGSLGSGGVGHTFKLEQLDRAGEPIGTYVGKVVSEPDLGSSALEAYTRVRAIAEHPNLTGIFETAAEWSPHHLAALLRWVEGEPLKNLIGALDLYPEMIGEPGGLEGAEALALGWAEDLCGALSVLHAHSLVHCDVTPANIIVNGTRVTLIDYDLVTLAGTVAKGIGTAPYRAPALDGRTPVSLGDDLFSLAATLFHTLTGRDPFLFGGVRSLERGLAWARGEQETWPRLAAFLDRAVDTEPQRRFADAATALAFLKSSARADSAEITASSTGAVAVVSERLYPNEVPRLKDILRSYPGSRFGNIETRGLDSDFARDTYVRTALDEILHEDIRGGRVSLVILCGNAGDGKTAFLQHLLDRLGIGDLQSKQRVWEGTLSDGIRVKVNLDGAAAWDGRSADNLLDDLFAPFHDGPPKDRRVHLVAVNDGRLMEWVESYEGRNDRTELTNQIADALDERDGTLPSHIRLVELNLRSLVGGLDADRAGISTHFVDTLLARLVGGDAAPEIWKPCLTCSARLRCTARQSAEMLGASRDPEVLDRGRLLRSRLTTALQAVHQRNEAHITARELKGALSYILFGLHDCQDLHRKPDRTLPHPADFAFDPDSELRQGELLRELTRFDPGLDAHPRIDRYLLGGGAPDPEHRAPRFPKLSPRVARRRAWFTWTDEQIRRVGGKPGALALARGRHVATFRNFPLLSDAERDQARKDVCRGISRLEELPEIALNRPGVTPIRIVPRTPTETAFWIEKPFERFTLEPERFSPTSGLETLHRFLELAYRTDDGRRERLTISLDLFRLLMELSEGAQILDAFSDDVFANLGVFTRRLAQEDERSMFAWHPSREEQIFRIAATSTEAGQVIGLTPLGNQEGI